MEKSDPACLNLNNMQATFLSCNLFRTVPRALAMGVPAIFALLHADLAPGYSPDYSIVSCPWLYSRRTLLGVASPTPEEEQSVVLQAPGL